MRADSILGRALDTFGAIDALKLKKGARLVGTSEGVEIHRRGLPTLILTHENAHRWAEEVRSADFE